MKRLHSLSVGGILALTSGTILASSMSLTQFKPRVMPVLVQVNSRGHVDEVLPSAQLTPKMQRLLVKDLGEWISKPAVIHGHPVDSQVIINVALRVNRRRDGNFNAHFAYVSAQPSPYGAAAHWVLKDGNQLALVSDSGAMNFTRPQPAFRDLPAPVNHWDPPTPNTTASPSSPVRPEPTPSKAAPAGR